MEPLFHNFALWLPAALGFSLFVLVVVIGADSFIHDQKRGFGNKTK